MNDINLVFSFHYPYSVKPREFMYSDGQEMYPAIFLSNLFLYEDIDLEESTKKKKKKL